MVKYLLPFICLAFINAGLRAQCPGCIVELPAGLAEDTIYLSDAMDGIVGQYYDEDLSFRMPKTTTPVSATDPDTPPGLDIAEITITTVSNLPPGLSWEANQTAFDPEEETDGCGKICGVPFLPGLYNVDVIVTAQVLFVEEVSAFSFPILIQPGSSITDGFTLENGVGCGYVAPIVINNIPSGGAEGFSYSWDFGNGQNSMEENPETPVYDEPGEYPIAYQAIVDTFGYLLSEVTVEATDCGDILGGAPDLLVEIYNPEGIRIFSSDEAVNTDPPVSFNVNLLIGEGIYELRIIDDDEGLDGGDDVCGSVFINQESNGNYTNGSLSLTIDMYHPVDTVNSVDTVVVYEQPESPGLFGVPDDPLCEGEVVTLFTQYDTLTQWYQDTMPMLDQNGPLINTTESGVYWVAYTTEDGCSATSDTVILDFATPPAGPVFQNFDNLLVLFDPDALPESYTLQWFLEGSPIEQANDLQYCIDKDGTYTLEVVDQETGCTAFYTLSVDYDPAFPNCMPSSTEELLHSNNFELYPNPATSFFRVAGKLSNGPLHINIYHTNGAMVKSQHTTVVGGLFEVDVSVGHLPSGLYWLELKSTEGSFWRKVVVK